MAQNTQKGPSAIRRNYILRLICRFIIFILCLGIYAFHPQTMDILYGLSFFKQINILHILWLLWVVDMLLQLIPIKGKIPLGSQKHFKERFKPIQEKINYHALREHIISTTKAAYKVFVLWLALLAVIGGLYFSHIIDEKILFLISVCFYVCDLICVLIWCPFRLIMKNRCCTTCRIFNWDHLMMFTPMIFMGGFFAVSLLAMAFAVWILWELCVMMYPERFWEHSNAALKCSDCTDKLCTQYCQKLRQK